MSAEMNSLTFTVFSFDPAFFKASRYYTPLPHGNSESAWSLTQIVQFMTLYGLYVCNLAHEPE